jgi:hypothetical protein
LPTTRQTGFRVADKPGLETLTTSVQKLGPVKGM